MRRRLAVVFLIGGLAMFSGCVQTGIGGDEESLLHEKENPLGEIVRKEDWESKYGIVPVRKKTERYKSEELELGGSFSREYIIYEGKEFPEFGKALQEYNEQQEKVFEAFKEERIRTVSEDGTVKLEGGIWEYAEVTMRSGSLFSANITLGDDLDEFLFDTPEPKKYYRGVTIDVNSGKILTLEDLGDIKEEVYEAVVSSLTDHYGRFIYDNMGAEEYYELYLDYEETVKRLLEEKTIWHLTPGGIRFMFPQESIGDVSWSVTVPFVNLSGLKEEYQPGTPYIVKLDWNTRIPLSFGEEDCYITGSESSIAMESENGIDFLSFPYATWNVRDGYYVNYDGNVYLLGNVLGGAGGSSDCKITLHKWYYDDVISVEQLYDYRIVEVLNAQYMIVEEDHKRQYLCRFTEDGFETVPIAWEWSPKRY